MQIIIKKSDTKKEIADAIGKLNQPEKGQGLHAFFGKLKGTFGDGLAYQKKVRNEWD